MATQTQYRKLVELKKGESKTLAEAFRLRGTKAEFERVTAIPANTLNRVLRNGYGEERVISRVRQFVNTAACPV
jgi:hypothetical protein